jgi:small subunit ribosomal protein S5
VPLINAQNFEFTETVVAINRVAKVVKGGKRFSFSALVVIGDRKGTVGASIGKEKELIHVPMQGVTIPHDVLGIFGAGKVLLKPAAPGTGVIAGGSVRAVLEAAGIKDVLTKSLRSSNPCNVVYATFEALKMLRTKEQLNELRKKDGVTSDAAR